MISANTNKIYSAGALTTGDPILYPNIKKIVPNEPNIEINIIGSIILISVKCQVIFKICKLLKLTNNEVYLKKIVNNVPSNIAHFNFTCFTSLSLQTCSINIY